MSNISLTLKIDGIEPDFSQKVRLDEEFKFRDVEKAVKLIVPNLLLALAAHNADSSTIPGPGKDYFYSKPTEDGKIKTVKYTWDKDNEIWDTSIIE